MRAHQCHEVSASLLSERAINQDVLLVPGKKNAFILLSMCGSLILQCAGSTLQGRQPPPADHKYLAHHRVRLLPAAGGHAVHHHGRQGPRRLDGEEASGGRTPTHALVAFNVQRDKLAAHPMFERVSDEELESDPAANLLTDASEEGQKVARNKGDTHRAVFRRLATPRWTNLPAAAAIGA